MLHALHVLHGITVQAKFLHACTFYIHLHAFTSTYTNLHGCFPIVLLQTKYQN